MIWRKQRKEFGQIAHGKFGDLYGCGNDVIVAVLNRKSNAKQRVSSQMIMLPSINGSII
jgi:hypothetical protein